MLFQKYNPSIIINTSIMRQGGVVAYPTEAVWGLGCDPHNWRAVDTILALKQRAKSKGLILVAATIEQLTPYLTLISSEQRQVLEESWPSATTWLVPKNSAIPDWVCGEHSSVALRVSQHPYVYYLCEAFGGAIVSTSANPQGKPAPRQAWQVQRYFHCDTRLDNIATGSVGTNTRPSTIIDLVSREVVR